MTDLEGTTRSLLKKGFSKEEILSKIISEYRIYKEDTDEILKKMAEAIIDECIKSDYKGSDIFMEKLLSIPKADVTIGETEYNNKVACLHQLGGCTKNYNLAGIRLRRNCVGLKPVAIIDICHQNRLVR